MTKYYLVVEEGYEYNDEYFDSLECDAYSISTKLLKSKEQADKIAKEKNDISEQDDRFVDYNGDSIRPFKVIEIEEDETIFSSEDTMFIKEKKKDYNVILLTTKWFKETFEKISEEYGNCELLEDVTAGYTSNDVKIGFHVDCGRYGLHRYNSVIVNKNGQIKIKFPEIIEGGDIEYHLEEAIHNFYHEK